MPSRPSRAETSPSCTTPLPESVGSSSCRAMIAADELLVLQRLAQQPGAVDGLAVVGEAERAGLAQLGHLGQRLAVQAGGDAGHEADGDARLAPGGLAQAAQDRRGVDGRARVGHRHDRDEAAGGRGARAGLEVLLVLLARDAQVHVRVDEAREDVLARAVDHLAVVLRGRCRARRSSPSRTRTSRRSSMPAARVEDVGALDQDVGGRRVAVVELAHAGIGVEMAGCGALRPASSS